MPNEDSHAAGLLFHERLRQLITESRITYRGLAARTRYSSSYLHDLASGRRRPTVESAHRIDDALAADGELRTLAATDRDVAMTADRRGIPRRTVIAAVAAAGLSPSLLDPTALRQAVASLASHASTYTTPDDWDELVAEYGFAYQTQPRADLLADIVVDLTALQLLIDQAVDPKRAALCHAGARLAALTAMACTDLDHISEARGAWRLARGLANEAGSADCQAWVRAQEATLGLYTSRPLPVLLRIADDGLRLGDADKLGGRTLLFAARAQTLAWMGRAAEAATTVIDMKRSYDALPDSLVSQPESIFGLPEHRLQHGEAFARTVIGTSDDAAESTDRALSATPATRVISRCQLHLHRSARLVRDGAVDDGMAAARDALTHLPSDKRGRLVLAVGESVIRAVPQADRRRLSVLDYDNFLTASAAEARVTRV